MKIIKKLCFTILASALMAGGLAAVASAEQAVCVTCSNNKLTAYLPDGDGSNRIFEIRNVVSASIKPGSVQLFINRNEVDPSNFTVDYDNETITIANSLPAPDRGAELYIKFEAGSASANPNTNSTQASSATVPFPGKLTLSSNGTLSVAFKSQSAYANAEVFLIILGSSGSEVKRVFIDPKKPKISVYELDLPSGSYSAFVELFNANGTAKSESVSWSIANKPAASFPGTVTVNPNGTLSIAFQSQSAYANAEVVLVFLGSDGREVKRIAIDPKNPKISASELGLLSGSYSVFVELTNANGTVKSASVVWTVSSQTPVQTPTATVNSSNGDFPGGIEITSSGTIRITIQAQSNDYTTKYYLIVTNAAGKEVKRVAINPRSPRISLNSSSFPPGSYTLQLEMVRGSTKVRSSSAAWVIPQPSLAIPSGDSFPGTIVVNSDGTFTVSISGDSAKSSYTYYIVVTDVDGNEVSRSKFDPQKPVTKSLNEVNLQTGGYFVTIEAVDPKTGDKATSNPTFTTYNGTDDTIVLVDNQLQKYEQPPVNVDGRTMVPLRDIFEALGAQVEWNAETRTVTATKDDKKIDLTIDSNVAWVNGNQVMLDVPAKLINEKTMVPIRFVSEALGADVKWDGQSRSVMINNKE